MDTSANSASLAPGANALAEEVGDRKIQQCQRILEILPIIEGQIKKLEATIHRDPLEDAHLIVARDHYYKMLANLEQLRNQVN